MSAPAASKEDGEDGPVRIRTVDLLSNDWGVLRRTTFDYRRNDGAWETLTRETYDRGNGATILPYDPRRGTVLLVRQFRLPAYVNGHPDPLIEACAGLLDADDPETCIRREAEEETGYRLRRPQRVFEAFMSPGSVTEKLAFFVAEYAPDDRIASGGGDAAEGEDIAVIEMTLDAALGLVAAGGIIDGKTIMLLQHLKLYGLPPA